MCLLMAFLLTRIGISGSSDELLSLVCFLLLLLGRVIVIFCSHETCSRIRLHSAALEVLPTSQ